MNKKNQTDLSPLVYIVFKPVEKVLLLSGLSDCLDKLTSFLSDLVWFFNLRFILTCVLSQQYLIVLALVVVPVISVAVRQFGRFLRELSHKTQAAAAVASSIAEVCLSH